jgi:hypothetical protein
MYLLAAETIDYVTALLSFLSLLATGAGLGFVVRSLNQASEQQRVEAGPYVRVDLGSVDLEMPDFQRPQHHYRSHEQVLDLRSGEGRSIVLSAWFRNLQTHNLGTAFGVRATFVVEGDDFEPAVRQVEIPYLEAGKPVLVDILRCQTSQNPGVILSELRFYDFYDRQHRHQFGSKGTNALHGRLRSVIQDGKIVSDPEGRSRGHGVEFGD